jgi:hypothetical protein
MNPIQKSIIKFVCTFMDLWSILGLTGNLNMHKDVQEFRDWFGEEALQGVFLLTWSDP